MRDRQHDAGANRSGTGNQATERDNQVALGSQRHGKGGLELTGKMW